MKLTERETSTYSFDDLSHLSNDQFNLIDISKVRMIIPGYTFPVDLGSWCYTITKKPNRETNSETCALVLVDLDSYRKERQDFVRRYLWYLFDHLRIGKSPHSLQTAVWVFSRFVKWCDVELPNALDNCSLINVAITSYSEMLIKKIRMSIHSVNTAAVYQVVAINALKSMYDEKYGTLFEGVRRIRKSQEATNVTEPPSEKDATKAIEMYRNLFYQLSNFVINFSEFPMKLQLSDSDFWFFPNEIPFARHRLESEKSKRKTFVAYNLIEGRLNSELEIYQKLYSTKDCQKHISAKKIYTRAFTKMQAANKDRYHHRRILAATLAQQSFIMLFAANTGMGVSQISAICWDGREYEALNERQGFKTIKQRANGKEVSFLITSSFYGVFRSYLRLRNYLLDAHPDQECNRLFFSISAGKIKEVPMDISNYFNVRLKRLFDFEIKLSSRQWRAYKSDWLIRNNDLMTTAMVLQNTPSTVINHYIAGSESVAVTELTSYFEAFNKKIIISAFEPSKSISVGQCVSNNSPIKIENSGEFEPDCQKPEGCLSCVNYAAHSDVIDLRKIISYKYILEQTRHLAESEQHFNDLFNPIFSRIHKIVEAIKLSGNISNEVYDSTVRQVYEFEQLDEFWRRKLDFLIEMELI
jgi:hypothetical protein